MFMYMNSLSCSCISVFHCKAVGSELSFDTCSEFRWISLVDILNSKKPTRTINEWNSLPEDFLNSKSVDILKSS